MTNGPDLPDTLGRAGWWQAISRRVRERDTDRQLLYNRLRKASRSGRRFPALLPEFLQVLLGTVLAFWIIASLLSYFFHAQALYTYAALGLIYSLRATYHKYRLSVDPNYTIRRCKCGGVTNDRTETVLKSAQSAVLGVPNSVLGAAFYCALLFLAYAGYTVPALVLAVLAVAASIQLAHVMVWRIGALCTNCINISALNLLILWQLTV
jgi:uncharacterized membrane protein